MADVSPFLLSPPTPRWTRTASLSAAVAVHLLVLLLLLLWPRPVRVSPPEEPTLKLWTIPPPPVVVPEPPRPVPPQPRPELAEAPAGGSDAGAPPVRVIAPVPRSPDPVPMTPPPVIVPQPVVQAAPAASPTDGAGLRGQTSGTADGAIGTGQGTGSGAGVGAGSGGSTVTVARWVKRPGPRELNPDIPTEVRKRGISGKAFLVCRVRRDKHLRDCSVLKETPQGSGFGAAALAASPKFRIYPPKVDGKPADLAWVIVPIEYNFIR